VQRCGEPERGGRKRERDRTGGSTQDEPFADRLPGEPRASRSEGKARGELTPP
jgi:hypothetical protein